MKNLNNILANISVTSIIGNSNIQLESIHFDSRKIKENSLFVATSGTQVDGHSFIQKAIELGATAIVCEKLPELLQESTCYIKVKNSQTALDY